MTGGSGDGWGPKHKRRLRSQRTNLPGLRAAWESSLDAMLLTHDRRDQLDAEIAAMAADSG